jgi:hypothetical protein
VENHTLDFFNFFDTSSNQNASFGIKELKRYFLNKNRPVIGRFLLLAVL